MGRLPSDADVFKMPELKLNFPGQSRGPISLSYPKGESSRLRGSAGMSTDSPARSGASQGVPARLDIFHAGKVDSPALKVPPQGD